MGVSVRSCLRWCVCGSFGEPNCRGWLCYTATLPLLAVLCSRSGLLYCSFGTVCGCLQIGSSAPPTEDVCGFRDPSLSSPDVVVCGCPPTGSARSAAGPQRSRTAAHTGDVCGRSSGSYGSHVCGRAPVPRDRPLPVTGCEHFCSYRRCARRRRSVLQHRGPVSLVCPCPPCVRPHPRFPCSEPASDPGSSFTVMELPSPNRPRNRPTTTKQLAP